MAPSVSMLYLKTPRKVIKRLGLPTAPPALDSPFNFCKTLFYNLYRVDDHLEHPVSNEPDGVTELDVGSPHIVLQVKLALLDRVVKNLGTPFFQISEKVTTLKHYR